MLPASCASRSLGKTLTGVSQASTASLAAAASCCRSSCRLPGGGQSVAINLHWQQPCFARALASQPLIPSLRQPLCENLVRDFGPRPSTCGWRCSRVVEEKRQGWAACRPARGAGVARSRGRDQLLVATHRSWSCRLEPGAGSGQDPRATGSRELWAGSGKESSAAGSS